MKHTYTRLRETKKHTILCGLHDDIRFALMTDYDKGNIKSITIKDGGYFDDGFHCEEVRVKMNDGNNCKFVFDNGKWTKKVWI